MKTTISLIFAPVIFAASMTALPAEAAYHFSDYAGRPPIHISATTGKVPKGITPVQIQKVYGIPAAGGTGTVVIIAAYNAASIEKDLAAFDTAFQLPPCTSKNKCLTKHLMTKGEKTASGGWELETALDVEWVHAIAPKAKILLVEAATPSGANLLKAIDYADRVKDASAISMSWGGAEFPEETSLDSHFASVSKAPFFASSGDSGAGVSWPAASPEVISVGGTTLLLGANGNSIETAWSGSGGGASAYEKAPAFQASLEISHSQGMRAVPDVAYDANPATGFPIVHNGLWHTVGGTSAGAPQWAALASIKAGISNEALYKDAARGDGSFHDIVSGSNGTCAYYCSARAGYDYVTGLGTPRTASL